MSNNYILTSKDKLTELVKKKGVFSWDELTEFIKNLPYGRNKNRTELRLVISEKKGTCSSKHALLKKISNLNNIPNVKLVIGIYRMNKLNTPKIGKELAKNAIKYIPEAHCYLKINGKRMDFTTTNSEFKKIEKYIMQEIEIEPEQVSQFKVDYHKLFIKKWIKENNLHFSIDEIWEVREKCIQKLTE